MYCHKCGKEIMNEAIICPACGVPTASATEAATRGRSVKKTSFNILTTIHTVILVFAIIIGSVFIYNYAERVDQIKNNFYGSVFVSAHDADTPAEDLIGYYFTSDGYCTRLDVYYYFEYDGYFDEYYGKYEVTETAVFYSYDIELFFDSVYLVLDGKRYNVNMYDYLYYGTEDVHSFESKDRSEVFVKTDL